LTSCFKIPTSATAATVVSTTTPTPSNNKEVSKDGSRTLTTRKKNLKDAGHL
jgi:hypothetical protein